MTDMPDRIWVHVDGTWGDDDDAPITEDEARFKFEYIRADLAPTYNLDSAEHRAARNLSREHVASKKEQTT